MEYAGAEILKPFPILQLAAGALVVIVGVYLTLRAAKDNKKDAHIAPPTHDPLGLTVLVNSFAGMMGTFIEIGRNNGHTLAQIHTEQVKTNARLAELKDSHESEMDELRKEVRDGLASIPSARRRRAT